jgi:parallel beta-helix repeat protein
MRYAGPRSLAFLFIGVMGVYFVYTSHASTPIVSQEVELGTLSGNVCGATDSTASANGVAKFGTSCGSAPTSPTALICGNSSLLNGPSTAPAGAITVAAGNNSSVNFTQTNKTFWFAPGVHTLGTSQYSQVDPGTGATYIGAPGAIIDGQNLNDYAFSGQAKNVTIKNLEFRNFTPPGNEGAVNTSVSSGWNISNNYLHDILPGTALYIGTNGTVSNNCITHNGQEALGTYTEIDVSSVTGGAKNVTVTNNEVSYNNTCNWEQETAFPITKPAGCGNVGEDGCGCSGGIKFWTVDGATIANNYVHDNYGVAIWADTNNTGFLIENNYVSNNLYEGLVYETSYNALIRNNTFINNAYASGRGDTGFPHSAIYISESGSDSRVPGPYGTEFLITGNKFVNNWGGVVLWEGSNRYCSSSANTSGGYCTLVNPTVATLTTCANDSLRASQPYYGDCRWKTQNVSVKNNTFTYTPATIGADCTADNNCGYNGLISVWGTYPPYEEYVIPIAVSNNQNNHFSNNTYTGPWRFVGLSQGDPLTWSQWSTGWTDSFNSGVHFNAQDAGSTYN